MPIIIQRRRAVPLPVKDPGELEDHFTPRQQAALEMVGLLPSKPPQVPLTQKSAVGASEDASSFWATPGGGVGRIPLGTRVRVSFELFPRAGSAKKGDTGVVVACWNPPSQIPASQKENYLLYQVLMDHPRSKDSSKAMFRAWELERLKD